MGRKRYFIQEAAWEGLQEPWKQEVALKSVLEVAAVSRQGSSLFLGCCSSHVKITENPRSFLTFPLLLGLPLISFCGITDLDL